MKTIERSPNLVSRIAGLIYVTVFVAGIFSLVTRTGLGFAAAMVAGVLYIGVTVLFYFIFKPANPTLSLIAAIISLCGFGHKVKFVGHKVKFVGHKMRILSVIK